MPLKDPIKRKKYRSEYTKRNKEYKKLYDKKHYMTQKEKKLKNAKEWSQKNPNKRKTIMSKWLDCNSDERRSHILKYQYGITLEVYNDLFQKQQGCCAICGKHQSKLKRRLHVDHDHSTGVVRELICQHCNTAIGLFGDCANVIGSALQYILKHKTIGMQHWQMRPAKQKKKIL